MSPMSFASGVTLAVTVSQASGFSSLALLPDLKPSSELDETRSRATG